MPPSSIQLSQECLKSNATLQSCSLRCLETTEIRDFVSFAATVLAQRDYPGHSHVQSRQCNAVSGRMRVDPETVRLWLRGDHRPSDLLKLYFHVRFCFENEEALLRAYADYLGRPDLVEALL